MSAVETVAQQLRQEILAGERPAGARLVEQELTARYGVARHTLRAALRALAAEGLVRIEPNRGARVARLTAEEIVALYELRTALEVEAARLALERHGGRLPAPVHEALAALERGLRGRRLGPDQRGARRAARRDRGSRRRARASRPRTPRSTASCSSSSTQLEPLWSAERMAADHVALVRGLERDGPAVLREHLGESAAALVAAEQGTPRGRPCRRPARAVRRGE